MCDPKSSKRLDLQRKLKSVQRPRPWKLFARSKPEFSEYNPHTGFVDFTKWDIREESRKQESIWRTKICGYDPPSWEPTPPAWFRRMLNRSLRTRQKSALRCAMKFDQLDDFDVPPHRRTVRWLWW